MVDSMERRAAINRLREHLTGPMPDDLRWEVEATLKAVKSEESGKRKRRSLLWRAVRQGSKRALGR